MYHIFDFMFFNFDQRWLNQSSLDFNWLNLPSSLLDLALELEKMSSRFNITEILNSSCQVISREKQKTISAFFAGHSYLPKLDYPWLKQHHFNFEQERLRLEKTVIRLRKFIAKNDVQKIVKYALFNQIKDLSATIDLIEGLHLRREKKIKAALNQKYPAADSYLLLLAQSLLRQLKKNQLGKDKEQVQFLFESLGQDDLRLLETEFSALDIKAAFDWILHQYKLHLDANQFGYQVVISPNCTHIEILSRSAETFRTICIPANCYLTGIELLEFMQREIENKARHLVNHRLFYQGHDLFRIDDDSLLESLSVCDLRQNCQQSPTISFLLSHNYQALFYVLAADLAESGQSFWQIFHFLTFEILAARFHVTQLDQLDFDQAQLHSALESATSQAWDIVYRIMRGHLDTSNKLSFACRKDLAYLRSLANEEILSPIINNCQGNCNLIMASNILPVSCHFNLSSSSTAIPFLNFTKQYCFDILLPYLKKKRSHQALTLTQSISRQLSLSPQFSIVAN